MDLALNNLQRLICHKNQPIIIRFQVFLSNTNNIEYRIKEQIYLWGENYQI